MGQDQVASAVSRFYASLRANDVDAWVNLFPGMPRWLGDGSGFLWVSEHAGATQLELHDPKGQLVRVLVFAAGHVQAGRIQPVSGLVAAVFQDGRRYREQMSDVWGRRSLADLSPVNMGRV